MVSFHAVDPEWWSCKRKKRYPSLPDPMPKGMHSYGCIYCLGVHLASDPLPMPSSLPPAEIPTPSRPRITISNHAILRWQQRIEKVSDTQAVTAMLEALGAADEKHFKPSKLRKRTFYIPTPRAMFVGSKSRIITVLERGSDDYAEAKATI